MADPRFPIGKFEREDTLTPAQRRDRIDAIASAPRLLREAVRGLSDEQLGTPYREGGWTARQVVHHLPDSHMNAYVRLKLALTEDNPIIKPFDESAWAGLPDALEAPVEASLTLLDSLHDRWVRTLEAMSDSEFRRTWRHPERSGDLTLDWLVGLYAWHGRHHIAHITSLRDRMDW